MARRYLVPIALVALVACAQRPVDTAAQPLIPKAGPDANVRVEYDGGVFNRRLSALFSVKRPSYVMVAHLGGDGVIRVLFPEDGRESGLVAGGKTFRTDVVAGDYDAAPGYWFMRPTMFRSIAARNDSYDGNGHGYVFMIASATPLRFDRVSEFGLWNEEELPGYVNALDPRTLVRQYANSVAPSGKYTLDYASSMSSFATYSYADHRMNCAMMASYLDFSPWGMSSVRSLLLGSGGYFSRGLGSCMNYMDRSYYAYVRNRTGFGPTWNPVSYTPPAPPENVADPKALNPRDGRRDPLAPGREVSSSYRPTAGRRFDPERRASNRERVHRAPTTPRRDEIGMRAASPRSRDYTPRGESPRSDAGRRADAGSSGGQSAASRPASTSGGGGRSGDSRPGASEMKGRNP
jgi:hypothetical protein